MNPQTTPTFIDPAEARKKLIDSLGMQGFSIDEQDSVLERVLEVIMDQIMIVVLTQIPAEEHEKFEKMLDAQQMDAAQAYIQKNVPNLNGIINDVFEIGVDEYKRLIEAENAKDVV